MSSHDVERTIWSHAKIGTLHWNPDQTCFMVAGEDVDAELCSAVKAGDRVQLVRDLVDLVGGQRQLRAYVVRVDFEEPKP
jgi:hypothetical protein